MIRGLISEPRQNQLNQSSKDFSKLSVPELGSQFGAKASLNALELDRMQMAQAEIDAAYDMKFEVDPRAKVNPKGSSQPR